MVGIQRRRAAIGLLAVAASSVAAALVAVTLFGVSYNGVIAAQGLWNADVFAERPPAGLAAVNTALTVGTITGPAVTGVLIQSYGYTTALVAAVAVGLAVSMAPPRPTASEGVSGASRYSARGSAVS